MTPHRKVDLRTGHVPVRRSTFPHPAGMVGQGAQVHGQDDARRYLEHFVTTGSADARLRHGATGRPERRFRRVG